MFDYIRYFKHTNDVNEKDISILKELDLLDRCSVVVFGLTFKNFINMKDQPSIEPTEPKIDKKTLKLYNKTMKDDMKNRIDLKKYLDRTGGK
jgi:hypothetical protein